MTITLPQEQEKFLAEQLATGQFADESEVMAKALERWQRQQEKIAEIQAKVEEGRVAMQEGRYRAIRSPEDAEKLKQDVIRRGKELRAKRKQTSH